MDIHIDTDIVLKQLEKADAPAIFQLIDSQRDYLGKWLPFVEFTHVVADTQAFVNSVVDAPDDKFEYVFTIQIKDQVVGLIGFRDTDKINRKTEIGYWLSESLQGQGIVTRSVSKLCAFAFDEMKMNGIRIRCAVGNEASSNIPKRLGFKLEGIERDGELLTGDVFADLEIYSLLKNDPRR